MTFAPKSEVEIENCQVLGVVQAENVEEAKMSLLKDNTWIKESGFDIERSYIKQVLRGEQRDDINCVLNFLRAGSESLRNHPGCGQSQMLRAVKNLEMLLG